MRIIRDISQMSFLTRKLRLQGKGIGFVPTMGALHQGHLSLIRKARKENDIVVASIFVNPTQFGPKDDFKKYPRHFNQDVRLCKKGGVDIIFYPQANRMYPDNYKTYVDIEELGGLLCGRFRPGHFRGVATIVTKLFNIVEPHIAYFGQKDAQQAVIIKKIVDDLNIPVRIKVMPTAREDDGLAISSRNAYLSQRERSDAVVLFRALTLARNLVAQGNRNTFYIIQKMGRLISQKKNAKIQYISIVNPRDLSPLERVSGKALISLAVWIGKTRLIDNIIINPKSKYYKIQNKSQIPNPKLRFCPAPKLKI